MLTGLRLRQEEFRTVIEQLARSVEVTFGCKVEPKDRGMK
jgi:hypothetical protein